MLNGIKKTFLLVTGFLACPCHLPFVLPALAAGLAGTAVGAFIDAHTGLLTALATVYFVGVVVYFLSRDKRGESQHSSQAMERSREYVENNRT